MESAMSDVIRPKKHRRRNRAGRRKRIATVDSIPPGRAPLGFVPPEPERTPYFGLSSNRISCPSEVSEDSSALVLDVPACHINGSAVSASTLPFPSLDAGRIKLLSPSNSWWSTHDIPPPNPDAGVNLSHLKQHSTPVLSGTAEHSSHLPQRPLSAAQLASVTPPVPNRLSPAGFSNNLSTRLSSPGSRAVSLDMDSGFLPSLSSQARAAELNAAAAARTRNISRELDDFNDLASSQPIPLTALSMRAHSRNKGSKSWRPLSLHDVEESIEEVKFSRRNDIPGSRTLSLYEDTASVVQLQYGTTPMRTVNHQKSGNVNIAHTERLQWVSDMDHRLQKNPLSQFVASNSPSGHSSSDSSRYYVPTVSFSGPISPVYSRSMRTESISPTKQEVRYAHRGFQQNVTFENLLREDPFMSQSEFPQYASDSYAATEPSRSRFISGSETSHQPLRQQGQLDTCCHRLGALAIPEDTENEFYDLSRYNTVYGHVNLPATNAKAGSTGFVCHQTPKSSSILSSSSAKRPSSGKARLPVTDEFHSVKSLEPYDTKKEMAAYLNSVVEASKSNTARTVLHDPLSANKDATYVGRKSQEYLQDREPYLFSAHDRLTFDSAKKVVSASIGPSLEKRDERLSLPVPATPKMDLEIKSIDSGEYSDLLKTTSTKANADGTNATNGNTFKFPPPGLSMPALPMDFAASAECFPRANSRLVESNTWFHTDNRGEKNFRQKVQAIAREDAERRRRLRGDDYPTKEDLTAVQTTLLLGDVLANLQSYIVRPQGEFANFGNVPPHCCEPSHGGRRSYFDRDPSVDQWRFPSRRTIFERPYRPFERAADAKLLRPRMLQ